MKISKPKKIFRNILETRKICQTCEHFVNNNKTWKNFRNYENLKFKVTRLWKNFFLKNFQKMSKFLKISKDLKIVKTVKNYTTLILRMQPSSMEILRLLKGQARPVLVVSLMELELIGPTLFCLRIVTWLRLYSTTPLMLKARVGKYRFLDFELWKYAWNYINCVLKLQVKKNSTKFRFFVKIRFFTKISIFD